VEYSLEEVLTSGNDRFSKHFHVGHNVSLFWWEWWGGVRVVWVARPRELGPGGLRYTLSSRCRFLVNRGDVGGPSREGLRERIRF